MRKILLALALLVSLAAPAQAIVYGQPIAPTESASAEGTHVFATAPANLYGAMVAIGSTAGYVMVFNTTAAPADGAVTPALCFPVPASTPFVYNPQWPVAFSTGISMAFSTTGCFTKTASNAFFAAQVR